MTKINSRLIQAQYPELKKEDISFLESCFDDELISDKNSSLLLEKLCKKIGDITYSPKASVGTDNASLLYSGGMIKEYSDILSERHHISTRFDDERNISLDAWELRTVNQQDGLIKGFDYSEYVNNYLYVFKLIFPQAERRIDERITVKSGSSEQNIVVFLYIAGILGGIILLPSILDEELGINLDEILGFSISGIFSNIPSIIIFGGIVGLVILLFLAYKKYNKQEYVKKEKTKPNKKFSQLYDKSNKIKSKKSEFEKNFSVFSKDMVTAEAVFSPSFSEHFLKYVNSISKTRSYKAYFEDNHVYIIYDFKVSTSYRVWDVKEHFSELKDYVELYLEMKNLKLLTKELEKFYYR